ncbi:hypothetical protein D3C74_320950 [compost metagenome]
MGQEAVEILRTRQFVETDYPLAGASHLLLTEAVQLRLEQDETNDQGRQQADDHDDQKSQHDANV